MKLDFLYRMLVIFTNWAKYEKACPDCGSYFYQIISTKPKKKVGWTKNGPAVYQKKDQANCHCNACERSFRMVIPA